MPRFLRRFPAFLICGAVIAVSGTGLASARMGGSQIFRVAEGLIFTLGSKRAVGHFQNVDGKCQLSLMIAEAVIPDVAQPPSSAQMLLGMVPGQSVMLGSAEGESLTATCGVGGETLEVTKNHSARS